MLLPYSTDAPVYHYPFATIAIISLNAVLFLVTGMGDFQGSEWLILEFDRINPLQWVTAAFMHASWMHLIGNMIFLWCFALVVEGKLGWQRFGLLYLGLALADGAIGQIPMFLFYGGEGGALGASGVVFALMMVACIWAPFNDIDFILTWGWFVSTIEIPLYGVAAFYVGKELLFVILLEWQMSTPMLHLMGAFVGVPFAIVMLKRGWVDCEGWDLFSRTGIPMPAWPAFGSGETQRGQRGNSSRPPTQANFESKPMTTSQLVEELGRGATQSSEPAVESGSDSRFAILGAFTRAVSAGSAEEASASFRSLHQIGCIGAVADSHLVAYARLLDAHQMHLDCLLPLRLLIARGSKYASQACVRVAWIEYHHRGDAQASIEALKKITKPIEGELLRHAKEISKSARARLRSKHAEASTS
ncbi:MAG: rhomboid family intramembrane serine protease [Planctomycetota bacterium]